MSQAVGIRGNAVLPDDVLPELEALCRQFHIRSLTLFGSANTPKFDRVRSDMDFLVEYEDRPADRLDEYFKLKDAFASLFGRPVDLVTKAQIVNPYVRRTIERNHRQIIPRLPPDEAALNKGVGMVPTDRTAGRLWDVSQAIDQMLEFVAGSTRSDFQANGMLRSATYHQLTIVGEALTKLTQSDPTTASRIPDLGKVVGMRIILVHLYGKIDDNEVWKAATISAPALKAVVDALLRERGPPEP